jgi:hypothetical protein
VTRPAIPPSAQTAPSPTGSTEGGTLVYLYGVLAAGTAAHEHLLADGIAGLAPEGPLYAVEVGGLVAATSRVPAARFDEEPLNALIGDLGALAPYAVRHEEAVRALFEAGPAVVPLAFGAIYRDEAGVRRLLTEGAERLRGMLQRLTARQEWGVKLLADQARLAETVEQESERLRRLAAEAASAGPGRAYLLARSLERSLTAELERLSAEVAADLLERLAVLSVARRIDALPAQPDDGRGGPRLVAKAAYLLKAAVAQRFAALVVDLHREQEPRGFGLELSGPWPPYSFAGVEPPDEDADDNA